MQFLMILIRIITNYDFDLMMPLNGEITDHLSQYRFPLPRIKAVKKNHEVNPVVIDVL